MNYEDDEDEFSDVLYADGHWDWDCKHDELKFISNFRKESNATLFMPIVKVGQAEFRGELDVIEQQRFKKVMQRKSSGEDDIVTLQDVKDLALYCAPPTLLSAIIIDVLHTSTTERFLRALILYCQYFIQVAEAMEHRNLERQNKIPTQNSHDIEATFQENINDLRLLVSKEYSTMILGGDDFKKFHHMGKDRRSKSMTTKEAMVFEPLIRISVQIVWIALERKKFNLIELEVNRLFRGSKFNLIEHRLGSNLDTVLSASDRLVLQRQCKTHETINNVKSPFYNEVQCNVDGDFRMLGLGSIKYDDLNKRLSYLEYYLTAHETNFQKKGVSLGIIGLSRSQFDTMLKQIATFSDDGGGRSSARSSANSSLQSVAFKTRMSKASQRSSSSRQASRVNLKINIAYPPIELPKKCSIIESPNRVFPLESLPKLKINAQQYAKWLHRVSKRAAMRRRTVETQKEYV